MRAQIVNIVAIVIAIICLNRELFASILLALARVCFFLLSSSHSRRRFLRFSQYIKPKKKNKKNSTQRFCRWGGEYWIANKVMKGTLMIPFSSILLLTFGLWKINFNPCRFNDLDYFSSNWISLGPRSLFISLCRQSLPLVSFCSIVIVLVVFADFFFILLFNEFIADS